MVPRAAAMPSKSAPSDDVIDKASFFKSAPEPLEAEQKRPKSAWVCASLRPVPAFYPLEKSSRFVDDEKDNVTERLSECLRVLSVQAIYNNETVSKLEENIESATSQAQSTSQMLFLSMNRRNLFFVFFSSRIDKRLRQS